MRGLAAVAWSVCLGLLAGCGGDSGLVQVSGPSQSNRAVPYADLYNGDLDGYGVGNSLWFRLARNGAATGQFRPAAADPVALEGAFGSSRILYLSGGRLTIEAEFRGAHHPLNAAVFYDEGVRCLGTWRADGAQGPFEAWHRGWPPSLSRPRPTYPYTTDNGTTIIIIDGGDDDSEGDAGGGWGSGTAGTIDDEWDVDWSGSDDGPLDSGGGGSGDDIIYRRRR